VALQGVTFEFGGSPPFSVEVSTPRAQEVLDAFRDARRALGSGFKADTPRLDAPSSQGFVRPAPGHLHIKLCRLHRCR
jgi:hypothetical protein